MAKITTADKLKRMRDMLLAEKGLIILSQHAYIRKLNRQEEEFHSGNYDVEAIEENSDS